MNPIKALWMLYTRPIWRATVHLEYSKSFSNKHGTGGHYGVRYFWDLSDLKDYVSEQKLADQEIWDEENGRFFATPKECGLTVYHDKPELVGKHGHFRVLAMLGKTCGKLKEAMQSLGLDEWAIG